MCIWRICINWFGANKLGYAKRNIIRRWFIDYVDTVFSTIAVWVEEVEVVNWKKKTYLPTTI